MDRTQSPSLKNRGTAGGGKRIGMTAKSPRRRQVGEDDTRTSGRWWRGHFPAYPGVRARADAPQYSDTLFRVALHGVTGMPAGQAGQRSLTARKRGRGLASGELVEQRTGVEAL